MRALVLIHRWLGIAFCLLFAMWFASGMVMHFVPFPSLTEGERVAGLAPIDLTVAITPLNALTGLGENDSQRLRLIAVAGNPVYVGRYTDGTLSARDARSGKKLAVNDTLVLASARIHARMRGLDATRARLAATESHDQ